MELCLHSCKFFAIAKWRPLYCLLPLHTHFQKQIFYFYLSCMHHRVLAKLIVDEQPCKSVLRRASDLRVSLALSRSHFFSLLVTFIT